MIRQFFECLCNKVGLPNGELFCGSIVCFVWVLCVCDDGASVLLFALIELTSLFLVPSTNARGGTGAGAGVTIVVVCSVTFTVDLGSASCCLRFLNCISCCCCCCCCIVVVGGVSPVIVVGAIAAGTVFLLLVVLFLVFRRFRFLKRQEFNDTKPRVSSSDLSSSFSTPSQTPAPKDVEEHWMYQTTTFHVQL